MERIPEFIANHLFLVSLFAALLIMLLWNILGTAVTGVSEVEPADATRMINREGGAVVDVRSAEEYAAGHILDAVHVPLAELESRRGELDRFRGKPLIAVCGNGAAAGRAARQLKQAGFTGAVSLRGGIAAWQGAHLPLTRSGKH